MSSQLPQVRQREPEAQNPDDEPLEVASQGMTEPSGPPELPIFITRLENLRNHAQRRLKILREHFSSYKLAPLKEVIENELDLLQHTVAALQSTVVFIDRKLGIERQQAGIAFRQRPLQ